MGEDDVSRLEDRQGPAGGRMALGPATDFAPGTLRMARAGSRRLLVVHTSQGLRATDLACPHQGYALTQGDLSDDGTLTCSWHNWKYRMEDGRCLVGEEDLRLHPVTVVDGTAFVELSDPSPAAERARLLPSLRSGIDGGYTGQMARDVVRLLRAEADPVQLVWEAVAWGAPRGEFGFGHAMASLVDCLRLANDAEGDARTLPVVQALVGISDAERRRPLRVQPEPAASLPADPGTAFCDAIESEDLDAAESLLRGAILSGTEPEEIRRWLVGAVSAHHLGYGHAAIYVQKAFELLDLLGWDRADAVLPHLVPALGSATREDRLPYMRPFLKASAAVDHAALAGMAPDPGWADADGLREAMLGREVTAVVTGTVEAICAGAGVEGLLDTVVSAGADRLLRYDTAVEVDPTSEFGWLDISHVVTYAHAARWAWRRHPGPETVRLAMWTAFQAFYAGRRGYREVPSEPGVPVPAVDPRALCRDALGDGAGSFIAAAHLIKTSAAACAEAEDRGNPDVLAGANRFVHAPRRERFVGREVHRAIGLADGRTPS